MTKKTPESTYIAIAPSSAPGGYIAGPALDRLNGFNRMAFDLEAVLADRNTQAQGVRNAVETYTAEYGYHATQLLEEVGRVESGNRSLRDLEGVIEQKIAFFKQAASFAAHDVPRKPDEFQIHAKELAERNKNAAQRGSNSGRN